MLISSAMKLEKLFEMLTRSDDWSRIPDKDWFLCYAGSDGELSLSTLKRISLSLEYWERTLIHCDRKSRLAQNRKEQLAEIKQLKRRLEFAFRVIKDSQSFSSTLLLTPQQENELAHEIDQLGRKYLPRRLNQESLQLTRWVYWFGGVAATRRFIAECLELPGPECEAIQRINAYDQWLESLESRWAREPNWVIVYEFRTNKRFLELIAYLKSVNRWEHSSMGSYPDCFPKYRDALVKVRKSMEHYSRRVFPALLAAWSACAKHGDRLPRLEIHQARNRFEYIQLFENAKQHVHFSQSKAYAQVLSLANRHDLSLSTRYVENAMEWFLDGNSAEDVLFCIKHLSPDQVGRVSLAKLRDTFERSGRVFHDPKYSVIHEVYDWIKNDTQIDLIDSVLRWMEKFSELKPNERTKKDVISVLIGLSELQTRSPCKKAFLNQFKRWLARANSIAECFPSESCYPKQLRVWLRRLGYYQRLTNKKRGLPKSLRKSLMSDKNRRQEIEYLNALVDAGSASEGVEARLEHLLNSNLDQAKIQRKNIRDAQEACFLTGLEALRQMLIDEAEKTWVSRTGYRVHPKWSVKRIVRMSAWVRAMSPQQVNFLRQVLAAFVEHGSNFKSSFSFNSTWIDSMRRKGVAIEHWLFPEPLTTTLGNRKVVISVASDPYEVLMMGNYFGTCLSQGGCNQMSVISNASDANKQVVYVHDADGNVLARQLIAVNRRNRLLHYYLYLSNDISSEECRKIYQDEVERYCRGLAKRVGLKLGDSGSPSSLGRQFWYDDGTVAWSDDDSFVEPELERTERKFRGFTLQAGYNWPTVSCAQSDYESHQPRYVFVN